MRTICVYLEMRNFSICLIEEITDNFPCFVDVNPVDAGWIEFYVKCRQEDAEAIEERLERFV